ncbi:putative RNA methyltransferase [Motilibacter aurantiacus]|uniref:putative RNA methyltransferase n=1 Tax=Motilibacter aurantiacus TaxID=2714955 RepID=UPI0014077C36|nr:23S rRNA methyltransferase [Motilibacter aurantiacus]NHC45367.1 23S rRNA methyltransferase [Motilibacter aurantiacus]
MLADVVALLECPVCAAPLASAGAALRCAEGHSFDIARQGYVTLLPPSGRLDTGDSAEMVAARAAFLGAGHFDRLRAAVTAQAVAAAEGSPGCVLDLGAGTGWYLASALEAAPGRLGLALDASKPALRRAARAHVRAGAVACDAWHRLPVRTGAAAVALNVFAPRNGAELARVLAPGGAVVVAAPTARHLHELVAGLGLLTVAQDKRRRVDAALGASFTATAEETVEHRVDLSRAEAAALVAAGPSARHLGAEELSRRTEALDELTSVTVSVTVTTYRSPTSPR